MAREARLKRRAAAREAKLRRKAEAQEAKLKRKAEREQRRLERRQGAKVCRRCGECDVCLTGSGKPCLKASSHLHPHRLSSLRSRAPPPFCRRLLHERSIDLVKPAVTW